MTKEQLDAARKCVFVGPSGDVFHLLAHIDEQQAEIDRLRKALVTVCEYEGGNYIWWIDQARAALKEDDNESTV